MYSLEHQDTDQLEPKTDITENLEPLRIMFVAGEPSGDALGAGLIRELREKSTRPLELYGVGGTEMEKEGLESLFPINDLAIIGLAQIVPRIPKIMSWVNKVVIKALDTGLDAIVLIDSSGFNDRIASRLKKRGLNAPIIKYVAPQVWASRPWRAKIVKKFYDHILTLFPFEPEHFTKVELPATFVGHPLTNKDVSKMDASLFYERYGIMDKSSLLCLLPGSRLSEVKYLLPVYKKTIEEMQKDISHLQLVIPTTPNVHDIVQTEIKKWPIRAIFVQTEVEKYAAFKAARAALAASGTVAMELAMCGTPVVVAYKAGWLTATLGRPLIITPYVSLINIIANEEIMPEYLQERCRPKLLADAVLNYMTNDDIHDEKQSQLREVFSTLKHEGTPPSTRAAEVVLELIAEYDAAQEKAEIGEETSLTPLSLSADNLEPDTQYIAAEDDQSADLDPSSSLPTEQSSQPSVPQQTEQ